MNNQESNSSRRVLLTGSIAGFLGLFVLKLQPWREVSLQSLPNMMSDVELAKAYVDHLDLVNFVQAGIIGFFYQTAGLEKVADSTEFREFIQGKGSEIELKIIESINGLFSRTELVEILNFISSPAGKKLQQRHAEIFNPTGVLYQYNKEICASYLASLEKDASSYRYSG
jgi:hypothetical protein